MNMSETVGVIGARMCQGHRGQFGVLVSDEIQHNHSDEPMRLVALLPEPLSGLFGGRWWIEESELKSVDMPWVRDRIAGSRP